jgi:hypothetical protein
MNAKTLVMATLTYERADGGNTEALHIAKHLHKYQYQYQREQ